MSISHACLLSFQRKWERTCQLSLSTISYQYYRILTIHSLFCDCLDNTFRFASQEVERLLSQLFETVRDHATLDDSGQYHVVQNVMGNTNGVRKDVSLAIHASVESLNYLPATIHDWEVSPAPACCTLLQIVYNSCYYEDWYYTKCYTDVFSPQPSTFNPRLAGGQNLPPPELSQ